MSERKKRKRCTLRRGWERGGRRLKRGGRRLKRGGRRLKRGGRRLKRGGRRLERDDVSPSAKMHTSMRSQVAQTRESLAAMLAFKRKTIIGGSITRRGRERSSRGNGQFFVFDVALFVFSEDTGINKLCAAARVCADKLRGVRVLGVSTQVGSAEERAATARMLAFEQVHRFV